VKAKARVGYLPEESYLYPYLTSEETLDFYGKLFDLDRRERRERIGQLLEMIGLQHARRRAVGEFSKGMARRIGLAQALINDPDVVILDEPTSGLDPIGCRQIKDLILTLARRGKTVLMSSHLLADVEDVCDRVVILYNGKVQALGSIRDLLEERTRSRVVLPPELPPDVMRRVLAGLRDALGREPEIEHPRKDLEQFFLDVVARARGAVRRKPPAWATRKASRATSPPPRKAPSCCGSSRPRPRRHPRHRPPPRHRAHPRMSNATSRSWSNATRRTNRGWTLMNADHPDLHAIRVRLRPLAISRPA
jgi:ABC-2 type transport system ATP-binding protein